MRVFMGEDGNSVEGVSQPYSKIAFTPVQSWENFFEVTANNRRSSLS